MRQAKATKTQARNSSAASLKNRATVVAITSAVALAGALSIASATPAVAQSAPPTCNGLPATIVGTSENDLLTGTEDADVIVGLEGDDEIFGLGGDDVVCGGIGNDRIAANAGHDWVDAGPGNDWVGAGWGNDTVFGGDGDDFIRSFRHDDWVDGGAGNDIIRGGWGNDVLRGGDGNDVIRAYYGADQIFGNDGNDVLRGSFGPDVIVGGPGRADLVLGEQGSQDQCTDFGVDSRFAGCERVNDEAPSPLRNDADRIVGNGSPTSCTSEAVVDAVAAGGVIAFDCGSNPITIAMEDTARIFNNASPEIVIDGGGLVTLDGQGERRILYMNTCDPAQVWTTPHCNDQDHPRLTVENISFVNGNAPGSHDEGGGGGAIFARGGRLSVINSVFDGNRCIGTGPDVGGAAIVAFDQYQDLPVEVRGSTFRNGVCSGGGAISSIGVSWDISDSVFENNRAVGFGANPPRPGTPGGGNGGAIRLDGNNYTLSLRNTQITNNQANEGGGAVFFVSNNRTGTISISNSTLRNNPSLGFETRGLPGIFYLGNGDPAIVDSTLE